MSTSSIKSLALVAAVSAGLTLTACGNDNDEENTAPSSSQQTAQEEAIPAAADLQGVLARAVDPNVPTDQKLDTVVGGQEAPELFDSLTKAAVDSKAQFNVLDPVLPGMLPNVYTANVNLMLPNAEPQQIQGVEFVRDTADQNKMKLDKRWACSLVEAVLPDQVPAMCNPDTAAPEGSPAPAPEGQPAPAPAPEGQPAPAPAPEGQPAPAPAPEGQPAPAPAPEGQPAPAPAG
ncbi:hypothetical protein [Corynebacterium anserum]|uniref:hypothetical protein n=1 Tax=Corynebacterium anserum TaxID=2684406 RepID=UPI001639ABEC|nr:hypothetical protein [Corynebacterium anserum]